MVLKGHFHISTQELYNAVLEAKQATAKRARKKGKKGGKIEISESENEVDIEEDTDNELENEIGDYIIVDIE